ncbi:MAG: hypothetical protein QOJ97_2315, partial [Solirubrobacteraceae bacterium]|nr:hypothetical protein [Solirubrobacteraceae bacterium]
MRIALAQLNPTVGDIPANESKGLEAISRAREAGAQLLVFPELFVTGYPPEDLLLKEHFLRDARAAVDRLAQACGDLVAVVGYPERDVDVYNSAAVLQDGEVRGVYRKVYLPNYGVFDEQRYFQSGEGPGILELDGVRVGLTVCEDIWEPGPPLTDEALAGATIILNLSASPYHAGKGAERERMIAQRARDSLTAVVFCALVGGQDELVFDGHSLVVDHDGNVLARAAQFAEELLVVDVDPDGPSAARLRDARHRPAARRVEPQVRTVATAALPAPGGPATERRVAPLLEPEPEVYAALTLGLRDYVEKNGFDHVVLGL